MADSPRLSSAGAGALLLATVVVAWGLTWPVNKVVLATLPPVWAVVCRTAIATGALFVLGAATVSALLVGRGVRRLDLVGVLKTKE